MDELISIHAPRTGSDGKRLWSNRDFEHFNPRSPHGERRPSKVIYDRKHSISIHAPRTGSDQKNRGYAPRIRISIHAPRTGSDAAEQRSNDSSVSPISIHAPRTGSDRLYAGGQPRSDDFNPRSPHGERHARRAVITASCRYFNPRSPHGERLRGARNHQQLHIYFNPRSPHGERR